MQLSLIPYVCLVVLFFLVAPTVLADSNTRSVKVLDDAIWENKKADPGSDIVESAGGTKRYKGPESKSTTDQEAARSDKCAINNERGSPGFRDCYRKDERGEIENRNAGRKKVEDRMGASTGPAIPLVEETKKAPVFKEDE
ncbi:MAG: hypothetical protein HYR96_14255 [Deltaproteobacteria bacterium]|nr:hypothetical protein [Deltaproteobacteria bacterium]MBI3296323.1 hypothetical protein [Deltaproteobacteria bacterium]